jgi:hypothetical protein
MAKDYYAYEDRNSILGLPTVVTMGLIGGCLFLGKRKAGN